MVRNPPPPGFISSAQAANILECSVGMIYGYERSGQLHRQVPPGRKQGFFLESEVKELANALDNFFRSNINEDGEESSIEFFQATPEDMEGIYDVAASLFSSTTPAEARKPLVEKCPVGNYIVKRNSKIVAYIHLQPLRHDRMMAFMEGKIRGKDITVEDLDSLEPGKEIEILVKSVGATKIGKSEKNKRHNQKYFLLRLLRGTARELEKLGREGIKITKIYATSETLTGIRMAYDAKMELFGKPIGEARFRYVLDVEKSDLPLLQPYKKALVEWTAKHGENSPNIA